MFLPTRFDVVVDDCHARQLVPGGQPFSFRRRGHGAGYRRLDSYSAIHPTMSTTKLTEPIATESSEFHNVIEPSAPTFATTRFATV